MIDTKLTRVDRDDGEEWKDGGAVPLGFDYVWRVQPQLMKDEELAAIVADTAAKGKGVVAITGVTSAGLLTLQEERASQVDGFEVLDFRLIHDVSHLDRYIDRDSVVEGIDEEGAYLDFEIPANATIDVLNRWLLANYPDFLMDVEVTTHTSSGIGANVLTGLLGENRKPVAANGLLAIVGGNVKRVIGKKETDAYRGTQGYAGIVKKVTIRARKRPLNPSMLLLPLFGNTLESAFAGSYAKVLSHLAPWIYGLDSDLRISAGDILDLSGLQTIYRATHHGNMSGFEVPGFLAEQITPIYPSMICMRMEGPVDPMGHEAFITALSTLNEANYVGEVRFLDRDAEIQAITSRRGQVPERAREEGGNPEFYSTSMDIDSKILFDPKKVDFSDPTVRAAYEAAYKAIIRCYQPLEDLKSEGIFHTQNGHYHMTNTRDYYVGSHNPHPRVTGAIGHKEKIIAAKKKVTKALQSLHGQQFGPFTVYIQEGEKHYSHDALSQAHFAATQPHWSAQRARLTAQAGLVHNARAPEPYMATMRTAGYSI